MARSLSNARHAGAHADDEAQLVPGAPILSMSLGATRKFRIRWRRGKAICCDVDMANGGCRPGPLAFAGVGRQSCRQWASQGMRDQ